MLKVGQLGACRNDDDLLRAVRTTGHNYYGTRIMRWWKTVLYNCVTPVPGYDAALVLQSENPNGNDRKYKVMVVYVMAQTPVTECGQWYNSPMYPQFHTLCSFKTLRAAKAYWESLTPELIVEEIDSWADQRGPEWAGCKMKELLCVQ